MIGFLLFWIENSFYSANPFTGCRLCLLFSSTQSTALFPAPLFWLLYLVWFLYFLNFWLVLLLSCQCWDMWAAFHYPGEQISASCALICVLQCSPQITEKCWENSSPGKQEAFSWGFSQRSDTGGAPDCHHPKSSVRDGRAVCPCWTSHLWASHFTYPFLFLYLSSAAGRAELPGGNECSRGSCRQLGVVVALHQSDNHTATQSAACLAHLECRGLLRQSAPLC